VCEKAIFERKTLMKKAVFTFGLIAGGIVVAMMFLTVPLHRNGTLNADNGFLVGITTMVVALSAIFFGVRSYRDQQLQGSITFGRALGVGLLISLVASVCYAVGWEINLKLFMTDFVQQMRTAAIAKAQATGATAEKLAEVTRSMDEFEAMYANFVTRFGMTLMEIFPVGVVISLVSALLLKKKQGVA